MFWGEKVGMMWTEHFSHTSKSNSYTSPICYVSCNKNRRKPSIKLLFIFNEIGICETENNNITTVIAIAKTTAAADEEAPTIVITTTEAAVSEAAVEAAAQ